MGLTIVLEDERGTGIDSVEDPTNLLHRALPASDDREFRCLNRVDWYGDTIFNRAQMADVIEELKRIFERTADPQCHALLKRISALATRGREVPHLYLKFYGD